MLRVSFILMFLLMVFGSRAENVQFSLQRIEEGQAVSVTEASFPNQYLLIAVGYTGCPNICPTTLLDMKNMLMTMDKDYADKVSYVQPLFITIDPFSDTLAEINEYTQYFDSRIIGLRAKDWQKLDAVVAKLRASYSYKVDGKPVYPPNLPEKYDVSHSTYIYLLSPLGELLDVYPYDMDGVTLAKQVASYIEKS